MINKEIKEILQLIGNCCYYGKISEYKYEKYCNCITNLEQENERLRKDYGRLMQDNAYTLELERRNEKAIEELDKYINSCEIEVEHTLNNKKCSISVRHSKKVKNILQGENYNKVERAYLDDEWIGEDKDE